MRFLHPALFSILLAAFAFACVPGEPACDFDDETACTCDDGNEGVLHCEDGLAACACSDGDGDGDGDDNGDDA